MLVSCNYNVVYTVPASLYNLSQKTTPPTGDTHTVYYAPMPYRAASYGTVGGVFWWFCAVIPFIA